jgi:hypothetical protein
MKRTFIIVALIVALVAPVWAQNQGETPDGLEWVLTQDKKGVVVFGYTGTATAVNIPARINNLPVVEIEEEAFCPTNCKTRITSVVIPNTVTKIGIRGFDEQPNLTSVTFPTSLVEIGDNAFRNCTALTSINLPAVKTIGVTAFRFCTALTSISLPASITTIKNGAFANCTALTTVSIPASVTKITFGTGVFNGATNLNAVSVTALTNRGYKF